MVRKERDLMPSTKGESRSELNPGFLRVREAARYLGISPALLAKQARLGQGPKQRRVGRAVLYKIEDLQEFMESAAVCQ
jgi:predicted DNA-binding transcriptional regulator AlpA